jgi:class 3 adenylate cyclase
MAEPGPERRLAAVVAVDMVGYSRLMEVDEAGTLARLKTHRIELIYPAIAKNRGRVVKTIGDGMLMEFHSVVDAVACAAEIQRRMARRNADMSPARWIQFRIGINLGDVIVEEGDIFGDGVNVAARLETLAEPGGICVSGAVRDQVGGRLENVVFEDIGEQSVKNIARPIRTFRIRLEEKVSILPEGAKDAVVATVSSKKPSIAVLPLINISGDALTRSYSRTASPRTSSQSCRASMTCLSFRAIPPSSTRARRSRYRKSRANLASITSSRGACGRWVTESASPCSLSTRKPTDTFGPNATTASLRMSSLSRTR